MKVFGVTDGKYFIASAGHHDFVTIADLMVDGGQPGAFDYAGYVRTTGCQCWAEVKNVTFAEFYTDYQLNSPRERQYGVWMLEPLVGKSKVRLLVETEGIPDVESMDWRKEMAVWGTRGIYGDQPLKYIHLRDADSDHLEKIIQIQGVRKEILEVITAIFEERTAKLLESSTL